MFISVLDLFKLGIGPSSSHTNGPMLSAYTFRESLREHDALVNQANLRLKCTLRGSLAHTGLGHGTHKAVILGLHGYLPEQMASADVDSTMATLSSHSAISLSDIFSIDFDPESDLVFDKGEALPQHPNGMVFELLAASGQSLLRSVYFSIGGGFIATEAEIDSVEAPVHILPLSPYPYPFDSAKSMLDMSLESNKSIALMKRENECAIPGRDITPKSLSEALHSIWSAMSTCIERGLNAQGLLPGGLNVERRASRLWTSLTARSGRGDLNEWLCAYAMAVNEENAAGHAVVTAPTNGAAGVIPAVLYYFMHHEDGQPEDVETYLLTASAIGGLIKHKSSISGAEVGCQGEVGSAAAMAAAGLCAIKGGSSTQIEYAAEMALEHHLGMTCDPVKGLVQVPCIERNGFGAIKAYAAASLALSLGGEHVMPLDQCIEAMRNTGLEMSDKYKETSLGGLAQSWTEC